LSPPPSSSPLQQHPITPKPPPLQPPQKKPKIPTKQNLKKEKKKKKKKAVTRPTAYSAFISSSSDMAPYVSPYFSHTKSISLSPLPLKLTKILACSPFATASRASLSANATAWHDSSAGMMPSSLLSAKKAHKLSSSLAPPSFVRPFEKR